MKISYDREVDALYIRLLEGSDECRTLRVNDEVALNIGPGEALIGIEILDPIRVYGAEQLPDLSWSKTCGLRSRAKDTTRCRRKEVARKLLVGVPPNEAGSCPQARHGSAPWRLSALRDLKTPSPVPASCGRGEGSGASAAIPSRPFGGPVVHRTTGSSASPFKAGSTRCQLRLRRFRSVRTQRPASRRAVGRNPG